MMRLPSNREEYLAIDSRQVAKYVSKALKDYCGKNEKKWGCRLECLIVELAIEQGED